MSKLYSPANTAATSSNPVHDRQPRGKPVRRDGDRHDGKTPATDADAETLRQEQLPKLGAEALRQGAQDDEERARGQEGPVVPCIVDGARDEAEGDEEEALHGANGGDLKGRVAS
jgi:hypothetical protein